MIERMPSAELATPLSDFAKDKVVIHAVREAYPHLTGKVRGIDQYSTRALVLPAHAVYLPSERKDISDALHAYYKDLGFVTPERRYVPRGVDFLEGALTDVQGRESNCPLWLFGQSPATQEVLGGTPRQNYAFKTEHHIPTHNAARWANDKGLLRALLDRHGVRQLQVPVDMQVANTVPENEANVQKLLARRGRVMVKRVDSASGDALRSCATIAEVHAFVAEHKRDRNTPHFIVEEDLRDIATGERSAQFLIEMKENGTPHVSFVGVTEQIVQDKAHMGNVIDAGAAATSGLEDEVRATLAHIAQYMGTTLHYHGYVSFDILDTTEGPKVLEANARATGATYPFAICEQLARAGEGEKAVVALNTISAGDAVRERVTTFPELKAILGDVLYTRGKDSGVIPTLATTIPEKIGLAAVGDSVESAKVAMRTALERLDAAAMASVLD